MQKVSKKAIINMLIVAIVVAAAVVLGFIVAWYLGLCNLNIKSFGVIYFSALALILLAILSAPFIRYSRYRYQLDEVRILVREGLIFTTTSFAPIERVHQISVLEGPIDRLTGLAKVEATTAGGEIVIRFLKKVEAERLSSYIESTIKAGVNKWGNTNDR